MRLQSGTKLVETLFPKGPPWLFANLKKENAFPSPPPPCNVVMPFVPAQNNKHPNFEWREGGGVWIVFFCEVAPLDDNVWTILSSIVDFNKS